MHKNFLVRYLHRTKLLRAMSTLSRKLRVGQVRVCGYTYSISFINIYMRSHARSAYIACL
ncbi:MAG: hypothetical protein UV60_C0010G0005 [Parcubacteria group bacterium GW2011_GWA2_43_11]|nr:MAG: hypothetical protein UV60_C0010G0005 [Parcubacteria group bacterium GW2011_GWA2_43_11]